MSLAWQVFEIWGSLCDSLYYSNFLAKTPDPVFGLLKNSVFDAGALGGDGGRLLLLGVSLMTFSKFCASTFKERI